MVNSYKPKRINTYSVKDGNITIYDPSHYEPFELKPEHNYMLRVFDAKGEPVSQEFFGNVRDFSERYIYLEQICDIMNLVPMCYAKMGVMYFKEEIAADTQDNWYPAKVYVRHLEEGTQVVVAPQIPTFYFD